MLPGGAGSACVLVGYGLVSSGKLRGTAGIYQPLNVVGAGGLMGNTFYYRAYPSAALNLAWIAIAAVALVRAAIARRNPDSLPSAAGIRHDEPSSPMRLTGTERSRAAPLAQDFVVVAQVPDHRRFFFHDPNLARTPNGSLLVAAPQWGRSRSDVPRQRRLRLFLSDDGGTKWEETPGLPYEEGRPFVVGDRLYMFVQARTHTDFQVVTSDDDGRSWSLPQTVLSGPVWNISTSMAVSDGVLLWPMDYDLPGAKYGGKVMARLNLSESPMSAQAWSLSNVVPAPELPEALIGRELYEEATNGVIPGEVTCPFVWLEPHAVEVAGRIRVFARCTIGSQAMAHIAAVLHYDPSTSSLRFDHFAPWPGGQCKFFILHDQTNAMYWMLGNLVTNSRDYLGWSRHSEAAEYRRAAGERRWLYLFYSIDCLSWFPGGCVARWPDSVHQSFMYPSAVIDDDDLVVLSRTSRDSGDQHDADLCTVHRVRAFRSLAMDLHSGGLHVPSRQAG